MKRILFLVAVAGCNSPAVPVEVVGEEVRVDRVRWDDQAGRVLVGEVTARVPGVEQVDYVLRQGPRTLAVGSLRGPFAPETPQTVRFEQSAEFFADGGTRRADVGQADLLVISPIRLDPRPELADESEFVKRADADCRLGDLLKCADLAASFGTGEGVSRRDQGLHDAYGKLLRAKGAPACEAGVADACLVLGAELLEGRALPRDPAEGRRLIDLACKAGNTLACDYPEEAP